jgi:hypothetical protein
MKRSSSGFLLDLLLLLQQNPRRARVGARHRLTPGWSQDAPQIIHNVRRDFNGILGGRLLPSRPGQILDSDIGGTPLN